MLTWQNTGDPCTPETVTFVNHLMPTRTGYTVGLGVSGMTFSNPEVVSADNTNYSPRGLSYFDSTSTQQLVYTISKKIIKYPGNTDVSRGVAYTNGNFSFAQWRDRIYAANGADVLQKATTGSFADVSATAPKFTRIAVAGEFLAGIGLVADYVGSARTVTASPYILMISGVGNPDQFDVDIDTSAYYQDIYDTGGPLTAIARLRNFFVVFQKSGVYVVENVGGAEKWSIRCVTDYYGCEWPDSVIEVNNVLYWISPTRGGEVVAFDGSQITPLSTALTALPICDDSSVYENGFLSGSPGTQFLGGITAATDGETITWLRLVESGGFGIVQPSCERIYMNIPTSRFGYTGGLGAALRDPIAVFSNASQSSMLCVYPTQLSSGDNRFVVGALAPDDSVSNRAYATFYRRGNAQVKISNVDLLFSEYTEKTAMPPMGSGTAFPFPALSENPTLYWVSSQVTGQTYSKPESISYTQPAGVWNSATHSFDMPSATARSLSAKSFMFQLLVQPINSLTGFQINYVPSGTGQIGGKAGAWQ